IHKLIQNQQDFVCVMRNMASSQYKHVLDTLGAAKMREIIPNHDSLCLLVNELNSQQQFSFLDHFGRQLTVEQLDIYKDAYGITHVGLFTAHLSGYKGTTSTTGLFRPVPVRPESHAARDASV